MQTEIVDFINSTFIALASIFLFLNAYKVYQDKTVQGVSLISMTFFTTWGLWQVFYYWNISHIWSFFGTLMLAVGNLCWFGMALYYSRANRRRLGVY